MSPELARVAFRVGFLLVVPSVAMLFLIEPGTAEFSITVVTLVMGLVFLVAVTLVVLRSRR